MTDNGAAVKPPRDNLFRAVIPGPALRIDSDEPDDLPTLHGHFAIFDEWTEIHSAYEGHFMERLAPGAFKKTFRDQRSEMRALFQHGMDPQIGDKPLGPIETLEEDEVGARYSVPMLDTAYNRELIPGLEAGLYGASFRFRAVRESIDNDPDPADHNPEGLAERTVTEAHVYEFGPVTFPAYAKASAGVRSLRPVDLHVALEERTLRDTLTGDPAELSELAGDPPEDTNEGDAETKSHLARATRSRPVRRLDRKGKSWKLP